MATVIFSNQGDRDCEMLRRLWAGLDANVVELANADYDEDEVKEAIDLEDDLLIVAGHGSPYGLYAPAFSGYAFGYDHLPLVHAKRIVFVWCFASDFVRTFAYNLRNCFATYLFISNPAEAYSTVHLLMSQEDIDEVDGRFYDQVNVFLSSDEPLSDLKPLLQQTVDTRNPVDMYNRLNLHYQ